ncbi:hypothetical protein VMCG_10640 [Cytospora schulzeri]|uniref:Uncharacterized protein n=1 Tax=Cytospora schulzeri TaxID=448051 RepID=A0A423VBJ2_9PEZI|nr:hypothetical protein VMCG_10640 [Valsa malicola]
MTPPVFEGEGDQIKILGRYVEQIRRSQQIRLPWAAHHIVAFKRFLARGQHSPDSVKAQTEPQLRGLAESIGIPTGRLNRDQWGAVRKRILSSLLYRLEEFRKEGGDGSGGGVIILGDRLDVENNIVRWIWDAGQVQHILSRAYTNGDDIVQYEDVGLNDVDIDVDIGTEIGNDTESYDAGIMDIDVDIDVGLGVDHDLNSVFSNSAYDEYNEDDDDDEHSDNSGEEEEEEEEEGERFGRKGKWNMAMAMVMGTTALTLTLNLNEIHGSRAGKADVVVVAFSLRRQQSTCSSISSISISSISSNKSTARSDSDPRYNPHPPSLSPAQEISSRLI